MYKPKLSNQARKFSNTGRRVEALKKHIKIPKIAMNEIDFENKWNRELLVSCFFCFFLPLQLFLILFLFSLLSLTHFDI
jgi:hypothetical protein